MATDVSLPAPGIDWSISRTYMSAINGGAGSFTQGVNWSNSAGDVVLYQSDGGVNLLAGASSMKTFVSTGGSTYASPGDSYLVLTHDATNSQFVLTNQTNNIRWTFNDFSVTNTRIRGALKEQSTLQLFSQGKSGFVYSRNTTGLISQITSPTGQDYNLVFSYTSSGAISQIQVQDASSNLLEQAQAHNDIPAIIHNVGGVDGDFLQAVVDSLKGRFKGVIVLGSAANGAVALVAAVSPDFTAKIQAGKIIQTIAPIVGGKGGGKPDNARGGGKDASKLDEALTKAKSLLG